MKTIKLFSFLMLLLGLTAMNQSQAQTTTWIFDAGNGNGGAIKVIENGNGISGVSFWQTATSQWASGSILSIDDQGDYSYIRAKSTSSGRIYELYLYWYNDKLVQALPDGGEVTYWLRKS